jgi:hypothetical protein
MGLIDPMVAAPLRRVAPVTQRRDLHQPANRLGALGMAALVDKCSDDLEWRLSSAWTLKGLVKRRSRLPWQLAHFSLERLARSSSAAVDLRRWPLSRSHRRTQAAQPVWRTADPGHHQCDRCPM